jgi:hypothetical protein
MDFQKDKLNKWDYIVSVSSGALAAALDVFLVKDISIQDAHKWGKEEIDSFVGKVAKKQGFQGNESDTHKAIKFLEDKYPIQADLLTNDFGSGGYHHLRDFSHHPTVVGLLFSIVSQFTGKVMEPIPKAIFLFWMFLDGKGRIYLQVYIMALSPGCSI